MSPPEPWEGLNGVSQDPLTLEGVSDVQVLRVTRYIRDHAFEPGLQMPDVYERCNAVSRDFVYRFRRIHSLSPKSYLTKLRVSAALGLLAGSSESVTAIAFHTGFSNSHTLAMAVQRYTGLSPSEFRQAEYAAGLRS